jgi:hypothetical protein
LSPEGIAPHQYSAFKRGEYRFAPRKRININPAYIDGARPGAAASELAADSAPR